MRIEPVIIDILDRGRSEGEVYYLPQGQLDRKVYERVNKVLELAGGKWNRKCGGHVFADPASDALEPIFLNGQIADLRREFQVFETPQDLAADIVARAAVEHGHGVLEPSAGSGRIAAEAKRAGGQVACVEIRPEAIAGLREQGFASVIEADFLALPTGPPGPLFDRVVMNPPFAKGADAKHVLHALKFLRPGGRLVSVMAGSAPYRTAGAYRHLHQVLGDLIHKFSPLPEGAFRDAGTDVNTCLLEAEAA
jgi:predicted RNA methylase